MIRGKSEAIELLLVGLLARGHVLIEDVPGVGKTTLAKALAKAVQLEFARIQFTPDLLPADITGANVLNPREGTFSFLSGPIFTNLLLADEINRASPRTQSALLEAMNEGQVTVDGQTRPLPDPFFVVATENPVDFQGTYPLPEAQLDRFLLSLDIGYPDEDEELEVLFARQTTDPLDLMQKVAEVAALKDVQQQVREVRVVPDVARYILSLVRGTREHREVDIGVSPRGSLALFRAAQARALLRERHWASPDDVQELAVAVLAHRLVLSGKARYGGRTARDIIVEVIEAQDVPT